MRQVFIGGNMRKILSLLLCATLVAGCELERMMKPEPQASAAAKPPVEKPAPPTREQFVKAFTVLNERLRVDNERILDERGTRSIQANRAIAFDALHAGLVRLGMIVESRDPDVGTLTVAAPAPRPLSADEWRRTVQSDLPMMAEILCPILGPYCTGIKFEPDDYVIAINATVRGTERGGSEVSLTTRMREIAPRPGMPRRDYPPPTGVRMALDKIWTAFDQALADAEKGSARKAP
jgi:hypothetical protein